MFRLKSSTCDGAGADRLGPPVRLGETSTDRLAIRPSRSGSATEDRRLRDDDRYARGLTHYRAVSRLDGAPTGRVAHLEIDPNETHRPAVRHDHGHSAAEDRRLRADVPHDGRSRRGRVVRCLDG